MEYFFIFFCNMAFDDSSSRYSLICYFSKVNQKSIYNSHVNQFFKKKIMYNTFKPEYSNGNQYMDKH